MSVKWEGKKRRSLRKDDSLSQNTMAREQVLANATREREFARKKGEGEAR